MRDAQIFLHNLVRQCCPVLHAVPDALMVAPIALLQMWKLGLQQVRRTTFSTA